MGELEIVINGMVKVSSDKKRKKRFERKHTWRRQRRRDAGTGNGDST